MPCSTFSDSSFPLLKEYCKESLGKSENSVGLEPVTCVTGLSI